MDAGEGQDKIVLYNGSLFELNAFHGREAYRQHPDLYCVYIVDNPRDHDPDADSFPDHHFRQVREEMKIEGFDGMVNMRVVPHMSPTHIGSKKPSLFYLIEGTPIVRI